MIISHRHKFIFLHCRKTAGSSVTVSLSRMLGDADVQIGCVMDGIENNVRPPRSMIIGALTRPSLVPLKYLLRKASFWQYVNAWSKHQYFQQFGTKATHATAAQIQKTFPTEWAQYSSFCTIRNPWDKTVSDYFWRTKARPGSPSFSAYVTALSRDDYLGGIVPDPHFNWGIYTISDEVVVGTIIKYENLVEELSVFLRSIGVDWDGWMPKAKSNYKSRGTRPVDYRSMYNNEDAETVGRIYRKEIELGAYTF